MSEVPNFLSVKSCTSN